MLDKALNEAASLKSAKDIALTEAEMASKAKTLDGSIIQLQAAEQPWEEFLQKRQQY